MAEEAPPLSVSTVDDINGHKEKHHHLHGGHPKHLQFVESEPQHLPFSASLDPRRRVFYDSSKHGFLVQWSRQLRKNRDPEFIPDGEYWKHAVVVPNMWVLFRFDFWNISWQVAVWFTLGSICWIINGQYFMWPQHENASLPVNVHITGYSALVGGLLFWVGAYLAVLEALNQRSADAVLHQIKVRHLLEKLHEEPAEIQHYVHQHLFKKHGVAHVVGADCNDTRVGAYEVTSTDDDPTHHSDTDSSVHSDTPLREKWRWFGLADKQVGWWAAMIQFGGATCFTVAVISGTPGILKEDQWELQTALIWTMQVLGSIGFVVSSVLLMLEEQARWYLPALDLIGWHSAFWNLVGAIGFLLSAVFGYLANWHGNGTVCCQFWGTGFNTYYGSWAFLIASVLLLIEVQNKQPCAWGGPYNRFWIWMALKTGWMSAELPDRLAMEGKSKAELMKEVDNNEVADV